MSSAAAGQAVYFSAWWRVLLTPSHSGRVSGGQVSRLYDIISYIYKKQSQWLSGLYIDQFHI